MASLYELTGDALSLQDMLQAGEIDETIYNDTLESLDIDTKLENYCKIIRNLEAEAAACKNEAAAFAARQKSAENGVKRLRDNIKAYLEATGKTKSDAGIFKVSTRKSAVTVINDEKLIPAIYLIEQAPKIDKTAIKAAIKDGETVPGAEVVENHSVTIK